MGGVHMKCGICDKQISGGIPVEKECLEELKRKAVAYGECEYCALCYRTPANDKPDGLTALRNKKLLPFISVKLVTAGINIKGLRPNYCPMCGRKLKSEEVNHG
jgi:hypothetical protein